MYKDNDKPLTRLAMCINETVSALIDCGYTDPAPALLSVLTYTRTAYADNLAGIEKVNALQLIDKLITAARERN